MELNTDRTKAGQIDIRLECGCVFWSERSCHVAYQFCHLHAAATELLEALQEVLRKIPFGANWDADGNNPEWLKAARAAIAKATGRA